MEEKDLQELYKMLEQQEKEPIREAAKENVLRYVFLS